MGSVGGSGFAGDGNDVGVGNVGNDVFILGAGNDTAYGYEGNDYFYCGDGNDKAYGGAGVDVMLGEGGNDYLDGGSGVDYYWGGAGADTFVVSGEIGADVIQDFAAGVDKIELHGTGFASLDDVLARTSDFGSYSIITVDAETNIWVIGRVSSQYAAADFTFAS